MYVQELWSRGIAAPHRQVQPPVTPGPGPPNRPPLAPGTAATVPAPGIPHPAGPTEAPPGGRDDSAESIVGQLFAVSLTLASCAKTTDKFVAGRVMDAIDGIDHAIADLRTAIFARPATLEPVPAAEREEPDRGTQ